METLLILLRDYLIVGVYIASVGLFHGQLDDDSHVRTAIQFVLLAVLWPLLIWQLAGEC